MKKLLSYLNHWKVDTISISLIFFLLTSSLAFAQVSKVTGVVTDAQGAPMVGVIVTDIDTKKAVSTGFDGVFAIDINTNGTLSFTFLGFESKKVALSGESKLKIVLKPVTDQLKEVVVIGYGTQKKGNVTGAISSMKAKDFDDIPKVSLDQMMQGKLSGVTITNSSGAPGSSVSVNIRGLTSISGTNEPLYVIDGIPISGDARNSSTSGRSPVAGANLSNSGEVTVSPLALINPNDIESIDVLKDASATAIYGSRGANGVVLVTTKSGKKGTGKLSYETSTSIQQQTKFLKVMNLREYATAQNLLQKYPANPWEVTSNPRTEFAFPELLGEGTNWQKEIFKSAAMINHQLSFSGGKNDINYYISGGYTNQDGTVIGSGFKRYTFRSNLDAKVKEWLKVGLNVSGGITNETITLNSSFNGIISTTLLATPDLAVKNADGTFAGPPADDFTYTNFINPVASALSKTNELKRKEFAANLYTNMNIAKGLEYKFEIGTFINFSDGLAFNPSYKWGRVENEVATINTNHQSYYSINVKNLLTYNKNFSQNHFTLLLGQETNTSNWNGFGLKGSGFLSNDNRDIAFADPKKVLLDGRYMGSAALNSFFARGNFDLVNKYGISGSFRADGSSKFAQGQQWAYFPAISGYWKLSEEEFMSGTKSIIDNIKFRVGYGHTGNQQIPGNRFTETVKTVTTGLGSGTAISNYANPDLKWEVSKQTNIGVDFALFNSLLNVNFDVYRKLSENFLYQPDYPTYLTGSASYSGGIDAPWKNLGDMENKGFDLTLNMTKNFSDKFSWSSNLVVSKYSNKVLSLDGLTNLLRSVNINDYTLRNVTNTTVGDAVGNFYGFKYLGVIKNNEQLAQAPLVKLGTSYEQSRLGDALYLDVDNNGYIDDNDRTKIGSPHPDFTFGFTNSFKYDLIELSIFLQGSQGNEVMNLTRRAGVQNPYYVNQLVEANNFWNPENTTSNIPRAAGSDTTLANGEISDRYIEDGSYVRIQNVTLSYSLPKDLLNKVKLSNVRVYSGVQNLYTFTKYSGYDPEVGKYNQDALLNGVDNGRYPSSRTITLGLNIEF
ncbi:SusC/RagA family TonB-linked outer membrane protein [Flavobacterium aquicola]|uniref:TonB-linked SusC/RagA family outer membrane protein n=1 Tax=Flavobacterium aquicola TaxID=1682742 RepID=A0A3E0ESR2_9FLAO|nr:TonB-dependent receptor [Flavobacterium aquicola]REH01179.1 TonB-linked SusC/RagA family outer membrane protein [Flavobacterium aquicola]